MVHSLPMPSQVVVAKSVSLCTLAVALSALALVPPQFLERFIAARPPTCTTVLEGESNNAPTMKFSSAVKSFLAEHMIEPLVFAN